MSHIDTCRPVRDMDARAGEKLQRSDAGAGLSFSSPPDRLRRGFPSSISAARAW
jgi:hypothetical protein